MSRLIAFLTLVVVAVVGIDVCNGTGTCFDPDVTNARCISDPAHPCCNVEEATDEDLEGDEYTIPGANISMSCCASGLKPCGGSFGSTRRQDGPPRRECNATTDAQFLCFVPPICCETTDTCVQDDDDVPSCVVTTTKPTFPPSIINIATKSPTTSPTTSPNTISPTTNSPTTAPTMAPTTDSPTNSPTNAPTTTAPTNSPTNAPTTTAPTNSPTNAPTTAPTTAPTMAPTAPTGSPTSAPTFQSAICFNGYQALRKNTAPYDLSTCGNYEACPTGSYCHFPASGSAGYCCYGSYLEDVAIDCKNLSCTACADNNNCTFYGVLACRVTTPNYAGIDQCSAKPTSGDINTGVPGVCNRRCGDIGTSRYARRVGENEDDDNNFATATQKSAGKESERMSFFTPMFYQPAPPPPRPYQRPQNKGPCSCDSKCIENADCCANYQLRCASA